MTIAAMENLISNAERRAILLGDAQIVPRICDLAHVLPGMTGKIELVFEGEQEGPLKVARALIGKAVRDVFKKYFPDPLLRKPQRGEGQGGGRAAAEDAEYKGVLSWFESGNRIEISDEMPLAGYYRELCKADGLRELTIAHMKVPDENIAELASAMEFALDGLHQFSKIAKDEVDHIVEYKDLVGSIFRSRGKGEDDD
jgi:magnesium chelatase subunit I